MAKQQASPGKKREKERETERQRRKRGRISGAADKVIATREWMRKFNYFRSLLFFRRPKDSSAFSSTGRLFATSDVHPRTLCKKKNFLRRAINWARIAPQPLELPAHPLAFDNFCNPVILRCLVHCMPTRATGPPKCYKTFLHLLLLLHLFGGNFAHKRQLQKLS